jgi:very-short-patch-repair endonuclease
MLADLVRRQHGMVSRQQLLGAGLSRDAVRRRVNSGVMDRVARGVYAMGPVRGPLAGEWAAVLGASKGAVLAEWSAARVLELTTSHDVGPVTLLVPRGASGRREGARRCRNLLDDEVTEVRGLPVTTPARTLLDLARHGTTRGLEDALAAAVHQRLARGDELRATIARHPTHPGALRLRSLLGEEDQRTAPARSEAERRLLALLRRGGLPVPAVNARVHGFELDAYWSRQRLAIETDGVRFHSSQAAFHRDRRRDAVLAAAGILVMRVTWRHLRHEPDATLARIAQALVLRDPDVARCSCGGVPLQ